MTSLGSTGDTTNHELAGTGRRSPPQVTDRLLLVLTLSLTVLLVIAVVVSLVFWHTPASHPIELPELPRA